MRYIYSLNTQGIGEIYFADTNGYTLENIQFGEAQFDSTSLKNKVGEQLVSYRIGTRDITLTGTVMNSSGAASEGSLYLAKRGLVNICRIGSEVELSLIEDNNGSYTHLVRMRCYVKNDIEFTDDASKMSKTFQQFKLTLIAFNPFWHENITNYDADTARIQNLYSSPTTYTTVLQRQNNNTFKFYNVGDNPFLAPAFSINLPQETSLYSIYKVTIRIYNSFGYSVQWVFDPYTFHTGDTVKLSSSQALTIYTDPIQVNGYVGSYTGDYTTCLDPANLKRLYFPIGESYIQIIPYVSLSSTYTGKINISLLNQIDYLEV